MQGLARAAILAVALGGPTGCERGAGPEQETRGAMSSGPAWFADVTAETGVDFVNVCGSPGKEYILDSMGAGVALFDADSDGDLDLYLVQGSTRAHALAGDNPNINRLFVNDGGLRFTDRTAEAGVGDNGWGHGCAAGDIDSDGDLDLYVGNWGTDTLYVNRGDATFDDVSRERLPHERRWSTSCAFADYDLDGDLDLYVAAYLEFDWRRPPPLGEGWKGVRNYKGPMGLTPEPDALYRNDGAGVFSDASAESGVAAVEPAYALAVTWLDGDRDGDPDLYVANDTTPNYYFRNDGGRLRENGVIAGLAYNSDGAAQAGMGIACADVDADGHDDLFVTNFAYDHNTLYRGLGGDLWDPSAARGALRTASFLLMGWGTAFADLDADQDEDLVVVNGHLYPAVDESPSLREASPYRQPRQLFENRGRCEFVDATAAAGVAFAGPQCGRGLAVGDLDGDGDIDMVATNIDDRVAILRNDRPQGHWLRVELRQREGNRFAIGARVDVTAGGVTVGREVRAGSSYLSQSELTLHFGLGPHETADLVIFWPDGAREERHGVRADQVLRVEREAP